VAPRLARLALAAPQKRQPLRANPFSDGLNFYKTSDADKPVFRPSESAASAQPKPDSVIPAPSKNSNQERLMKQILSAMVRVFCACMLSATLSNIICLF